MQVRLDEEVAAVDAVIPLGPRLVVVGSTSFWGADSRQLCQRLAAELARIPALLALTGGMDGVGVTFGAGFAAARRDLKLPEHLFHLLPRGSGPVSSGVTVGAGVSYYERREILGRVGHVYLVVEGGPGTEHEVAVATSRGAPVIPLGRSGGHAGELHPRLACPPWALPADWAILADADAPLEQVTATVGRLVQAATSSRAEPNAAADGDRNHGP
jgi:hypothetical protein